MVEQACSARSGYGLLAINLVGKSAGTNRSEVAARRDATSALRNHALTGPLSNNVANYSMGLKEVSFYLTYSLIPDRINFTY